MEVRQFAERVLLSPDIQDKLRPPDGPLRDQVPGDSLDLREPARSTDLKFAERRTAPGLPRPGALHDPARRAVAHHILANHELQALEVMARTALLFPAAPAEFRLGLAAIMQDEQRHTRMHIERAAVLGLSFGALAVNGYIWKQSLTFRCVLDYLATLPLVFEGRNLDHTLELAGQFDAAGDARSSALMRVIHRDEIEHVRFGLEWLRRLKPAGQSDWQAFSEHLEWPLRPSRARGELFQREARRSAGMTDDFIDCLETAENDAPVPPAGSTQD